MLPGNRNSPAAMRQKARGRSPCRSAGSRRERQTGCRPAAAFPAQRPRCHGAGRMRNIPAGQIVRVRQFGPLRLLRTPLRLEQGAVFQAELHSAHVLDCMANAPVAGAAACQPATGRSFIVIGSPRCGRPGISAAGIRPERPGRIHASCDARHGRMGAQTAGAGNTPTQAKAAGAS